MFYPIAIIFKKQNKNGNRRYFAVSNIPHANKLSIRVFLSTRGFNLELKLGLPEEIMSATAGFGREVNMERSDDWVHEETVSWSINSTIKVGSDSIVWIVGRTSTGKLLHFSHHQGRV